MVRGMWLGLVLALAPAPAAQADARLGPVQRAPSAVTDAAGTLHVVSDKTLGQPDGIPYCRVPAGGTACSYSVMLTGYPGAVGDPHLLRRPEDGALILVDNGDAPDGGPNATFVQASGDGGSSWTPPVIVGRGLPGIEDATLTPGGGEIDTLSPDQTWQRVPLGARVERRTVSLRRRGGLGGRVGTLPDGRPFIAADPGARVRMRILAGDPFSAAAWTPWQATVRDLGFSFAPGPKGLFMATSDARHQRLWHWNGHRFTLRRYLHRGRTGDPMTAVIAQDGKGRVAAAWRRICGRRYCLVYGRGVVRRSARRPNDPAITVNAAGQGWLVFTDGLYTARHGDVALPLRS